MPMKSPTVDVSLIIVNWNTKQLLLNCIQSLYEETKSSSFEIIVVDNGSTDGSPQAVQQQFPAVRLICNNENLGFAKANNLGIQEALGRYICLVNSDIKILDGCIDRMCRYLDAHPQVGAIGPKTVNENMTFRLNCREFPTLWKSVCEAFALNRIFSSLPMMRGRLITDISQTVPQPVDVLSGCLLMIRRTAIEQIGMLDEKFFIYGEDRDWCKRLWRAGWIILFFPEAVAIHYGGGSSASAPATFLLEMIKSDFIYWQKHHSVPAQRMYTIIMLLHYIVRVLSLRCKLLVKGAASNDIRLKYKSYCQCLRLIFNNMH